MVLNPEFNGFQGNLMDTQEAEGYFQTHGTFPPFISNDVTAEGLQVQIEEMRSFAERSNDSQISEKLLHEIGYLSHVLVTRFKL